ncbi:major histocompatibility complex class I-related gene protein-like [Polypterus senegalus]|uniref:major histocompatibility complex class I-related gene protein-like n=1 Tax=Polypterus senegalus TaxID=55291 RepID=UPI001963C717|nr:major histocompatibility complex class I-related gene protein-like [Polypterus senegalus]
MASYIGLTCYNCFTFTSGITKLAFSTSCSVKTYYLFVMEKHSFQYKYFHLKCKSYSTNKMIMLMIFAMTRTTDSGTHSLWFFRVTSSENTHLPDHIDVTMLDDIPFTYFDSRMPQPLLQVDWIKKSMGQEFWDQQMWYILKSHNRFKWNLNLILKHFNHSGLHVYQSVGGCETDDYGNRKSFLYHGYDGKDFISLDVSTLSWTAAVPGAVFYKRKQEADLQNQEVERHYYRNICYNWLEKLIKQGSKIIEYKAVPKVMVFHRKYLNPVRTDIICHVTGFYPPDIEVNWVRDGESPVQEGVWSGEVLPNGDRTYQQRKILTVTAEDQLKHGYSCQVHHASLNGTLNVKWDCPTQSRHHLIAFVMVGFVLVGVFIWWICFRRRQCQQSPQDEAPG